LLPGGRAPAIERAPGTSRWGLRFADAGSERAYDLWYLEATRFFSRAGLLASVVAWALVFLGCSLAVEGAFINGVPYVFAAMAVVVASLVVTFVASLSRWVPLATALANAFAGLAAIGFAWAILEPGELPLAGMGMLTLVFFGFVVFRLHPLTAAIAVVIYVVAYEVLITAVALDNEIEATAYWVTTVLLANAYVAGLFMCALIERQMRVQYDNERTIEDQRELIEEQRRQADDLLLNILPEKIVERLKRFPGVIAERFEDVTVLFADIVSFTPFAAAVGPDEVVALLNEVFSCFDELARSHGVEKIKTVGDAYVAAGGLPEPRRDHAQAVANLALDMRESVQAVGFADHRVELRIGIASGPVVAGVIGHHKFAYDLWGDTVNTAARMESHGMPGEIQISCSTHDLLQSSHRTVERGTVEVKGKGPVRTWLLTGRR
jgi:class 3 adenylate cyclase